MILTASHNAKSMQARRNPGLSVSSTAGYSPSSNGLLSPRFPQSHRSLLGSSVPPSPSLPSLLPKHGKKTVAGQSRLTKRSVLFFVGVVVVLWLGIKWFASGSGYVPANQQPLEQDGATYEMVGGSLLPQEPSAVVVTNKSGTSKWTVSIPATYQFPLRPAQYREICAQSKEVSGQLMKHGKPMAGHRSYYAKDPHYMDVQEAEEQGLLPKSTLPRPNIVDVADVKASGLEGLPQCEKSMTYVMETSDPSFAKTLLALWTAYGLAMKEGRAFFIDDTRWPYGNFSSYFDAPPSPGCSPPPASHIVPCPHNARHILVSAATNSHTFGHEFNEEYEDPFKMEVQRQHKILALARVGFENLFNIREDDAAYINDRIKTLYGTVAAAGGISVGLHVRRGDMHPYEAQYRQDYIPLTRFLDTASNVIKHYLRLDSKSLVKKLASIVVRADPPTSSSAPVPPSDNLESVLTSTNSLVVIASDDPDIYSAPEFASPITTRAQSRIALASKSTLEAASDPKNRNKYIDEISGWEGGFYKDVFWSLGRPSISAVNLEALKPSRSDATSTQSDGVDELVPEGAMQLRELVGRSYLLDISMLAGADSVICTLSSITCRVLGVMKGWDAVGGSEIGYGWKNVDGEWEWRGIKW